MKGIPVIIYRVGNRRGKPCIRTEGAEGKDSCVCELEGGGYRNEEPFFLRTFINLMLDFIVAMWNRGANGICNILMTECSCSRPPRRP